MLLGVYFSIFFWGTIESLTCIINQFNPLDELRAWGQSFFGDWAQETFSYEWIFNHVRTNNMMIKRLVLICQVLFSGLDMMVYSLSPY